jgi:hypothetical protein
MKNALCLIAAAAAALTVSGSASPAAAQKNRDNCFRMSQLSSTRGWGDHTIYARVNVSTFYRIDLQDRCSSLPYQDNHLVLTPTPGSDLICGPLDLDLKVSENGALESCFIKSITRLTPEEAKQIPRKALP